ncbi:MAG: Zn-ribbon domain-containing OB-fold protein [Candidatus Baldrarchaeia archaeon]|nr:MAG: Zn-ribbon domain-containing OB-fold protein [Candidatus Bathyarchaeota archaeon]
MSKNEIVTIPGGWSITYHYSAGKVVSRFFKEIKEHGRIMATKCPSCGLVMLPPRAYCERCFKPVSDWVEVGKEGTIESFTVVYEKFEGQPDPPYAIAYVRLDGADTAMVNFVRGIDLTDLKTVTSKLRVGAKVKVVMKPPHEREGRITDFWYEFKS